MGLLNMDSLNIAEGGEQVLNSFANAFADISQSDFISQQFKFNEQLAGIRGEVLVFVRYWPQHIFQDEWVYNEADIDGARVVWARDLGDAENRKLRQYYPKRSVWLLEPDARPPKLAPYEEVKPEVVAPATSAAQPAAQPKSKAKGSQPNLQFEDVPR